MHTINGRKYYFGTRSEGYMYRSRLFRYNKNYYYANQKGILVTSGWYTLPSGKNIILTLLAGHTPEKERSTRLLIILTAMVH